LALQFSMMEFKNLWRTWVYSRADGITAVGTFLAVLFVGVQWGVLVGVILAMAFHIRATLKPHMARVGRFPGTEHYRDAERFNVETDPAVITLRIDESLYYANARYLEDKVARLVAEFPEMTDLILILHSNVRERLQRSTFIDKLSGQIFLSQHEAMEALQSEPDWSTLDDHVDMH